MMVTRRKARALTLQALYEIDLVKHEREAVVTKRLATRELSEENRSFIRGLVDGIIQRQEEIDSYIRRFATAWPLEQLSVIDRNILRLAIFEVLFDNEVSVKVAINEAVELAKKFGSDNSPKFINGVLGSVSALADK
ncbi:MAG: transcription antitermination factor NusB [Chloroflexi bacterium]|nr:transcription antitermination factor NusB [Chloroflexota bacterium]